MRCFKVLILSLTAVAAAHAQYLICTPTAAEPYIRSEGEAEPVSDIVLACTAGLGFAGASVFVDISLSFTIPVTSRTFNSATPTSEALVLIDEPKPGVVNSSNGFSYNGQVLGTPGIAAGMPGSGNVYQADPPAYNMLYWTSVPMVVPMSGTRYIRLTNMRVNATATLPSFPIYAFITLDAGALSNPQQAVGLSAAGLNFSAKLSTPGTGGAATATLSFTEGFAGAFRPRILTAGTPFSLSRQDMPGVSYYTESQFTPCFSMSNCASAPTTSIGFADSGTLLQAHITGLGTEAASIRVPNQVVASGHASSVIYLMVNGKPVTSQGFTALPVSKGIADAVYQVAAADPRTILTFPISVTLLDHSGLRFFRFPGTSIFNGYLGPINSTNTASPTAPEPRFVE